MAYIYPTAVTGVSDSFDDHVERGSVNPGTDYTAAYGDGVVAVAAGTVTDADSSNAGGGGRTVHVDHDDGTGADYLHLSSVACSAGQRINQGDRVGASGGSGYGEDWYYGPHLHISFRPNHTHGYGDDGNQDFDALVSGQPGPGPAPIESEENFMSSARLYFQQNTNGDLAYIAHSTFSLQVISGDYAASIARSQGLDINKIPTINEYDYNAISTTHNKDMDAFKGMLK